VIDGAFGMVPRINTRTVEREGQRFEAESTDQRFNTYSIEIPAVFSQDNESFTGTIFVVVATKDIPSGQELTSFYCWKKPSKNFSTPSKARVPRRAAQRCFAALRAATCGVAAKKTAPQPFAAFATPSLWVPMV
jgi:hypothetical protein